MRTLVFTMSLMLVCSVVVDTSAAPAKPANGANAGPAKSISIETGNATPGSITLAGRDTSWQLLVTGQYAGGRLSDLTRDVTYQSQPAGIVEVNKSGLVSSLKEGKATINITASGGATGKIAVVVTHLIEDVRINFANQITPLLTKFGCNSGGCHGKASGQNGFKLSLLGFEPQEDYEYLVREGRGRRLFPASPEHSLLLLKATGSIPHGGGARIDVDSPYYRLIHRWIEQGMEYGDDTAAVVERIEVFPKERLIPRGGSQQMLVVAHHTDGSRSDITRMTQMEPNDADMAEASMTGLVTIGRLPGVVAVMARYQAHVDVLRAVVPLGAPVEKLPPANNFVDELVYKQLKKLGLPPSPLCDDGTFLRRVTIDLNGRLPTREESEKFVANKDPKKYEKLVDRLLASDDYAYYFANKWSSVLRNRRSPVTKDPKPTAAFHAWIRDSLKNNKPYDQFVREIITVSGEHIKNPPVVWFRELKDASALQEDAAQLFLGQRIQCARCHHHPLEKWSQDDYYAFQAFFTRVQVTQPVAAKKKNKKKPAVPAKPAVVSMKKGKAQATNPRTGKSVLPAGLGGQTLELTEKDDPRVKLADWMAEPNNPFFARALANRYWKHFFSRGLVEPEDDMRVTNPPSNPELLDALAQHFVEKKFDMKDLIRTICTSNVYRLSAMPNEYNIDDKQNFSRFLPRRLNAEVLLDAIDEVTLSRTKFPGGVRAVQLPDNASNSYFLSVFGRPDAASACECERSSDSSLAQALHLFNSKEILAKITGGGKSSKVRTALMAADKRPHADRLRDLYLVALSRPPSEEETATLLAHVEKNKGKERQAYEDIVWALINTKEFLFNH